MTATDLTVILDDRPGELARLGELAEANVNIDLAYAAFGGVKVVATDDLDNARAALE